GYNLSDDATCNLRGTGDRNSTPASLDPRGLQDNGGPTQTIALMAFSPAVDAVPVTPTNFCTQSDGATPVATDQRGVPRPQGFACDTGAYEGAYQGQGFASVTAKLEFKQSGFALNAAFTLNSGSPSINPVTQPVQLQIGPYGMTLPAGSFHEAQGSGSSSWSYAGAINGANLNVQISAVSSGSYTFKATGSPIDFTGVSNPVAVAIGIGLD